MLYFHAKSNVKMGKFGCTIRY